MRKFLIVLLGLGIGYSLFTVALWRSTDGFCLAHIQSDLTPSSQWEVKDQDDRELRQLISQHFYYLGKGSQCYVFESEDRDVVLKFFRYPRYRLNPKTHFIHSPAFLVEIQNQKKEKKEEKLKTLFTSCLLAQQKLKEETGLVYLHLNKTTHLKQKVILHDKLNRTLSIDIDNYEFIVQKRGVQIYPYLSSLLADGKRSEAKQALESLATLLKRRIQKGIADSDAVIHKNSGFRGEKAFFLDVGGFKTISTGDADENLEKTTHQLRSWLRKRDLGLATELDHLLR
jgi:hypothetical protein